MYELFQGENPNYRTMRTCFLPYATFLRNIEDSVLKRDEIKIENTYMGLFLQQSKTDTYKHTYIYIYNIYDIYNIDIDIYNDGQ